MMIAVRLIVDINITDQMSTWSRLKLDAEKTGWLLCVQPLPLLPAIDVGLSIEHLSTPYLRPTKQTEKHERTAKYLSL